MKQLVLDGLTLLLACFAVLAIGSIGFGLVTLAWRKIYGTADKS